jgi:hypothetical protein
MRAAPHRVTIRSYGVGFGDCTLLSFDYGKFSRHVLIGFGSSGMPSLEGQHRHLRDIALDIQQICSGKLHAVVATHRHQDHINGFTPRKGKGPGDIIARLKPEVVIQPWTEDPLLAPDATHPIAPAGPGTKGFVASLSNINLIATTMRRMLSAGSIHFSGPTLKKFTNLVELSLPNKAAVQQLQTMARAYCYVHFGSRSGLEKVLPGVKTRVLGPPTLEQSGEIRTMRDRDDNEFWHLQASAAYIPANTRKLVFPHVPVYQRLGDVPPDVEWFFENLRSIRQEQTMSIVRSLDSVLNNTSVILLFEVGGKKLLFPGDAQLENWSYALERIRHQLGDVDVYKVGHHGSLNGTPKSLWRLFRKRSKSRKTERLITLLSTMSGKHGDISRDTEVPRRALVKELASESNLVSTQYLTGMCNVVEVALKGRE